MKIMHTLCHNDDHIHFLWLLDPAGLRGPQRSPSEAPVAAIDFEAVAIMTG